MSSLLQKFVLWPAIWFAAVVFFESGEQANWIYEKIRSPRAFYIAARNMINFKLGIPRIAGWITMSIETAVNCNLNCKYCMEVIKKQGVIDRPPLMDWDLFTRIINEAPDTVETVTFGGIGEPLLHPGIVEMIDYASQSGRRVCMFTNGTKLKGALLERLAASRLDTLNVSIEPDAESARHYRGISYDEIAGNIRAFATTKRKTTSLNVSLVINEMHDAKIGRFREEWRALVDSIKTSPQIGFRCVDTEAAPYVCSEFWRGNMDINTHGNVSPCCFDVFEELIIGNVKETPLSELIHSPKFTALLEGLVRGQTPARCLRCTESCFSRKKVVHTSRKSLK